MPAALLAAGLLLAGSTAAAQEHPDARNTSVNVNPFRLNASGNGILATGSAEVMAHQEFRATLTGQYLNRPLVVESNDDLSVRPLVSHRQQLDLTAAVGLFGRLEVGLAVPVTVNQNAELPGFGLGPVGAGGLGNMEVYTLANILSQQTAPLGLAVGLPVRLPTRSTDAYLGNDGFSLAPQIRLSRTFGPIRLAATGDLLIQPRTTLNNIVEDDRLRWRTGVMFAPDPLWGIGAEFIGSTPLESAFNAPNATRGELLVGGHIRPTRTLDVYLAAGRGIIKGIGSPAFRATLGVALHLGRPEAPRKADPCAIPEDGDLEGLDPQACPETDFDKDGLVNADDQCPAGAEDADGFADEDGCPDPDNDGDGVGDPDDRCPTVAEDLDRFADADGCPDQDNESDGLVDANDDCVSEPEDFDGYEDDDGCPDPDNDNDGLADLKDDCPSAPGDPEGNGCPKESAPKAKVTDERIELSERIYFVTDRAIIRPRSHDVLQKVGEVLKANPEIERIEIRGYADQRGETQYNRLLSWERAKVVRLYLVRNAGIAPDRLKATGLGEVDDRDGGEEASEDEEASERSWAKARRVEFKILERTDGP
jgi:outer membrane protein OmpA-like peptidoglycan-associated protein